MSINLELINETAVLRIFKKFSDGVQKRVVTKAMRAAGKPVVSAIRKETPKDTGALEKSIGAVLRKVPKGRPALVFVYIGARHGEYYWTVGGSDTSENRIRKPAEYARILERGVVPHFIRSKDGGPLKIAGRIVAGMVAHPGIKPNRFMTRGWDNSRAMAMNTLRAKLTQLIHAEAAKAK